MREQEDLTHDSAMVAAGGLLYPATMAKITEDFIIALEPQLRLRQLCGTDKELTKGGGDTRRFRKISALSEDQVGTLPTSPESSTPDPISTDAVESYVEAKPEWYSWSNKIIYQSIKKADYNAIALVKNYMVKAWARFIDKKVRKAILAVATVSSGASGETIATNAADGTYTTTLANPHIYKINSLYLHSGTGTVTYDRVNYVAGKIRWTLTGGTGTNVVKISYDYCDLSKRPSPLVVDAATKGKMTLADLLNAKIKVSAKYGNPKVAIVYDEEMGDLLSDNNVIANLAYDQQTLYKGVVTKLYGLEMIDTNFWYPGVGVVMEPGPDCMMFVVMDPFGTLIERIPGTVGDRKIIMWEAFDVICLNDDLICVINNCQSDAYAL